MIDLVDMLERQADARPDRPAFSWPTEEGAGEISYAGLLRRVAGTAAALADLPQVIGLLAEDGIDWIVADLAVSATGRTLVPIPAFFSRAQRAHLIADAGVGHLLCSEAQRETARELGLPCSAIARSEADGLPRAAGASRIIYTSGSTGTPKGVRLAGGQIAHSVAALAEASGATAADRHLSLLPFALLLEQICGIYLVLSVGARSHIAAGVAARCAAGDPGAAAEACEAVRPTTTVVVPQLLAALAGSYAARGRRAPDTLRFVAVGGAPVPGALLDAAWGAGIPACVGYGLSECCSVVSVSRPGSRSYTAGPPLPGVDVEIDDGEIVVSGPTVMQGYLGGAHPRRRWRTGDLGQFDADGNLVVRGRKDNLIVLPNGRNVSPEWIEAMVERDPRIGRCIVFGDEGGTLTAVVTPRFPAAPSFEADASVIVSQTTRDAPAYARPAACVSTTEAFVAGEGLLSAKGEPQRARFARCFTGASVSPQRVTIPPEPIAS